MDSGDDLEPDELHPTPERITTGYTNSLPARSEPQPAREVSRVIDDEDAEFQAAIKASLEGLPEGIVPPTTPPRQLLHTSRPSMAQREQTVESVSTEPSDDEGDNIQENSGKSKAREESPEIEKIDIDEMRRRRLAKFGGS